MELRHLRYFVAVATELNFTRAAEKLNVAQPALSTQIANLEAELEVLLLQRTRRSVQLTAAGQVFLNDARQLLAQAQAAGDRARRAARGEIGRLNIGFFSAPTLIFLPSLVRRYRHFFPDVEVKLLELTPDRQLLAHERGEIDVGFTRELPPGHPHLQGRLLLQERLMALLPRSHRLAGRAHLALSELDCEAFVLLERSEATSLYDQVVSACRSAGFSPRVVQTADLMATVATLVAAEQGVSLVPEGVRNLRRHDVAYVPLRPAAEPVPLIMSWSTAGDSATAAAFRQLIFDHADEIAGSYLLP